MNLYEGEVQKDVHILPITRKMLQIYAETYVKTKTK